MTVEQQHGQIPCPSCGKPLVLPVEDVLASRPIVCSACGLELMTKREASREALNGLAHWYQETQTARTNAGSSPASPATDGASRRPRRPRR